jgi:hypothetical protein
MKSSEYIDYENNFLTIIAITVITTTILALIYLLWDVMKTNDERNKLEADFVKIHGSSKIVSCENGFLMQHTAFNDDIVYNNTLHSPVRCGDNVNIQVKETARTGLFVGDAN